MGIREVPSVVVKVGYTVVSRILSVDVSTLLLVEIDLRLQNVDLLSLALQVRTEQLLLHLDLLFVFIVLVAEKLLVCAIQLGHFQSVRVLNIAEMKYLTLTVLSDFLIELILVL